MTINTPELGPIANSVIFENEHVRIWDMVLEPGEKTDPHEHEFEYVQIQVAGDLIAGERVEGNQGLFSEPRTHDVVPGKIYYLPRGGVEIATNVGEQTYRGLLVELKDTGSKPKGGDGGRYGQVAYFPFGSPE